MTLEELIREVPELEEYIRYMPEELWQRYTIRVYPPGTIIHQKDYVLNSFGLIARGEHRVINEFQNGNVYMIEKNEPIDFVGEVTILAGMEKTSVTIETLTETTVVFFSRKDFEDWISKDIHFLRLVAHKVAYKLYRSSYNRGARLFYPPHFILLDHILKSASAMKIEEKKLIVLPKTRQELYEECGITVKTINRTVKKLKEDDLIFLTHGKISMTLEQYKRAKKVIHHYVKYDDWQS
ncbi:Crp/Fnr family transcriptional regulator [Mediterraneibacter glycyrrhizinilyticus]|nr:Crp/Fnr family transcriptional regulator [Mediterraneibacter glycyrrhizinilyticus]